MIHFEVLNKEQLQHIFNDRKAKYLSQNNINRHYIINYNNDNTFTNDTYENNTKIGSSYGNYKFLKNDKGEDIIHIKYNYVFLSPNINSPFNENNEFYKKLFEGYSIGPFYLKYPTHPDILLSCLYEHQISGYKILNFYKK